MVAVGAVLAAHFALWITSLEMTTVVASNILVTAHPIFVGTVAFYVLGEKLLKINFAGILVSFCGVIILSLSDWGQGTDSLLGDVLAFLGGIAAGTYILGGRHFDGNFLAVPDHHSGAASLAEAEDEPAQNDEEGNPLESPNPPMDQDGTFQGTAKAARFSFPLRFGVPAKELAKGLIGIRCHQVTMRQGKEHILSCADAVGKAILYFYGEYDENLCKIETPDPQGQLFPEEEKQ